ncbi:sugar transferase [Microlunatus flavus]|uniref:sugar transferase n=1 Tax=Microlunatus flavus TaxID=1036181 RepID=UPI0018E07871|nr:sugar transferase [Microlunatus flavus]
MTQIDQRPLAPHHILARTGFSTSPPVSRWLEAYRARLAVSDLIVVVVAVVIAQLVRFGVSSDDVLLRASISYSLISAVLVVLWALALSGFHSREGRVVGSGPEEFRRVVRASFALFGTIAILAYLLKLDLARGYLAVALPVGLVLLLVQRQLWRVWLRRQRSEGRYLSDVLVVGSHRAAMAMATVFERDPAAGYRVVGVCEPGRGHTGEVLDIEGHSVPVLGDESTVIDSVEATQADMVAVSNTEFFGNEGMRALAWQLEATGTDLVVAPGVVDVAGPRLQVRPVAGLPLLHVDKPQYEGAGKLGKHALDLFGAGFAVLVLSPVMLVIALLVKLTSPGSVFYRSERIGLNGEPFGMLKFRSMRQDADKVRTDLLQMNEGAGPLFKMRNDPRVTTVGRFLRRFSLDELPQLFNVLSGQMSIVGPRPPLRDEVMTYTDMVHRRLLVKPGITGLWQVSGRSDLSWEESVRLDLYYVENWSLFQDIVIIWKTVRAVLGSSGAY